MKQMSGIPRPVDDLPAGSLSVRLIRGSMSNNITGHPVELRAAGKTQTVKTDESGRAQFDKIPVGTTVKASADVDGEHLESQEFPMPDKVGIRMMLVATDKNAAPATSPDAKPISGQVVIANQSRIVIEPADEAINVFYLLDISNTARVPVNLQTPFEFDLPKAAEGAGIMEGSSPQASYANGKVSVAGPFAPGHTFVQVGYGLAVSGPTVELTQRFPANFESLAVIAKKAGAETTLASPQLTNQRDMPAEGEMFIAATGGAVAAGQPISLTVGGLPHHSSAPRIIALALAAGIILIAVWAGAPKSDQTAVAQERKRLTTRRDKLMADLVRLESDRRAGRPAAADERKYQKRREDLLASLEQVYGALDTDDASVSPASADRAGIKDVAEPVSAVGS